MNTPTDNTKAPTTKPATKPDFGAKLTELEAITQWFESEEVDLNAALAKFERGMQLADELKRELDQVENRVDKIKAKFDLPAGGDTAAASDDTDPKSDLDSDPDAADPNLFS